MAQGAGYGGSSSSAASAEQPMAPSEPYANMKEALAAKGYEMVGEAEDGSDSDEDAMSILTGRIQSLPPDVAREKGKKAYEAGKYDKAIRAWQGGLKNILSSLCSGPEALKDMNLSELDLTLNLNIAMAYMKKEDFEAAAKSVEKALARREALPPHLITKALYRKAMAERAMRRLDECMETLKDLLQVEVGHAAAKQMFQEVEREWQKQCKAQKANFRKLFDKISGEDKKEEEKLRAKRAQARERCAVRWTADDVSSEDFDKGDCPPSDGRDWGMALTRTVLWSVEQLALEGHCTVKHEQERASFWFIGASSTCELRWLRLQLLLERMPMLQCLETELIGFLGETDPDNKRVPDPKLDSLPEGKLETEVDSNRKASLRCRKGTLEENLAKALLPEAVEGKDVGPVVPPDVCFIAHPQLHRYYTEFFPAISWLIQHNVPTVIIGASEPDPSWKQDEVLLKALGAEIVVGRRESPYPMTLPDAPNIKKCSHIIGFCGGKAIDREKLMQAKLDLLAQDYNVR